MRHSTGAKLILFTMVFAVSLATNRCVRAGKPWGWQKPINQKLGAFYTSNKAFKRPKSTSRSYRQHSSYSTRPLTATYTQPTYTQPTYTQPSVQSVIVTPTPAPVTPRPRTPMSVPAVQEQVPPRSANVESSSTSRTIVSRPAVRTPPSAMVTPADAKRSALNTAEAALKVLELGAPPVAKPPVAKPPVATPPTAAPPTAAPPTAAPPKGTTAPPAVSKGAVRIHAPKAPNQSESLPFRSTTDKFWE